MKDIMIQDALIVYPKCGEPFDVHIDASDYQIGGLVSQYGKPVGYFPRKFNKAQMNCTVTVKELLTIVEILKKFCSILLGQIIQVWTDHKNLTYDNTDFSSDRILRQRLVIKKFGAQINFVSGVNNEVADVLSRLDTQVNELQNMQECFLNKRVFEADVIFLLDFSTIAKH